MNEADLIRKLAAVRELMERAATPGEREAAAQAHQRLTARVEELKPPCANHQFSVQDVWARRLFIAMAGKMGLRAFRFKGQRRTTVVIHGTQAQVHVLWEQFCQMEVTLRRYLQEITDRVIREALGAGGQEDATEVEEPKALTAG